MPPKEKKAAKSSTKKTSTKKSERAFDVEHIMVYAIGVKQHVELQPVHVYWTESKKTDAKLYAVSGHSKDDESVRAGTRVTKEHAKEIAKHYGLTIQEGKPESPTKKKAAPKKTCEEIAEAAKAKCEERRSEDYVPKPRKKRVSKKSSVEKKKVGRPKKKSPTKKSSTEKKKVGRPKKEKVESSSSESESSESEVEKKSASKKSASKKKVGRPKKTKSAAPGKPKEESKAALLAVLGQQ